MKFLKSLSFFIFYLVIFQKVPDFFLIRLLNEVKFLKFKDGEVLFSMGDTISNLYIIRNGIVQLNYNNKSKFLFIRNKNL